MNNVVAISSDDVEHFESPYWGKERVANRRAVMLDLRLKGGKFYALPYSYMTKIKFDPSEGIEIFIADIYAVIKGRNLHYIYEHLLRHKVLFIQEDLFGHDEALESDTYVREIEVNER